MLVTYAISIFGDMMRVRAYFFFPPVINDPQTRRDPGTRRHTLRARNFLGGLADTGEVRWCAEVVSLFLAWPSFDKTVGTHLTLAPDNVTLNPDPNPDHLGKFSE